MKSIEKTLMYYELLMTFSNTSKFQRYDLPDGYYYEFYQSGDEKQWVEIQLESGSICNSEKALEYFHNFFDYFKDELYKRCFFIVNDNNEKIATATISLLENNEGEYEATVDWVAIKKEYQGNGLSKPLISKLIEVANHLGHKKLLLHTQTHTWLAAKLYLDLGFEPYKMNNEPEGWQILKTLTNHPRLKNVSSISNDRMFSKLAILINKKLSTMFEKEYSYSIWYKNGRNDVYVYCAGKDYEYKYHNKQETIELQQI